MASIADGAVIIQTSAESVPSTPSWFGEVVLIKSGHFSGQDLALVEVFELDACFSCFCNISRGDFRVRCSVITWSVVHLSPEF
jgi:hypothetical protein